MNPVILFLIKDTILKLEQDSNNSGYLDIKDLYNFTLTCKYIYNNTFGDIIWFNKFINEKYLRTFPYFGAIGKKHIVPIYKLFYKFLFRYKNSLYYRINYDYNGITIKKNENILVSFSLRFEFNHAVEYYITEINNIYNVHYKITGSKSLFHNYNYNIKIDKLYDILYKVYNY